MQTRGAVLANRWGEVPGRARAITPKAGPEAYKSYSWRRPLDTHWRKVSCEEARCGAFLKGWVTTVDTATALGQRQYHYIANDNSRSHHEERIGGLVTFTFDPGQEFFAGSREHEHRKPKGYDPITLVTGGDFRGNPRGTQTVIMRPQDWVDDFASHQERLVRAQR